jgi:hypothetical protein
MQTFKKLPTQAPSKNIATAQKIGGMVFPVLNSEEAMVIGRKGGGKGKAVVSG